jgi:pimeloyl-ACP methyl ester carboxylesterase
MSREDHLKSVNEMFAQWAEGERFELCKSWIAKSDQKTVARAKGELFSLDLRPKLKQVPCPTVLLAGYNDGLKAYFKDRAEFETRVGEQLKNAPGSRAVVHPDSRHFIMWDQPAWLYGQIAQTLKSLR